MIKMQNLKAVFPQWLCMMKIFLSCQRKNDKGKYWLVWQPQFKNSLLLGKYAELVSRILNEFLKSTRKI